MNMLNACILESQKAAKITACFFFLMLHFFNTDMRDKYTTAMQLERVSLRELLLLVYVMCIQACIKIDVRVTFIF